MQRETIRLTTKALALGALLPLAAACGSTPLPVDRVAAPDATIKVARAEGAEQVPAAALHLKLAQEQYAVAQKLIHDGDNKQADLVLREAEADAETAIALSKEAKAKTDAQAALQKLHDLNTGANDTTNSNVQVNVNTR